jgi:hypothetical protein
MGDLHMNDDNGNVACCLITNEPLCENSIKLNCGHEFNYVPLMNELKFARLRRSGGNNNNNGNVPALKCPYCRCNHEGRMPYISKLFKTYMPHIHIKNVELEQKLAEEVKQRSLVRETKKDEINKMKNEIVLKLKLSNEQPQNMKELMKDKLKEMKDALKEKNELLKKELVAQKAALKAEKAAAKLALKTEKAAAKSAAAKVEKEKKKAVVAAKSSSSKKTQSSGVVAATDDISQPT